MTWNNGTYWAGNTNVTYTYPLVTSGSSVSFGMNNVPPPLPLPTPLEWLDAEVERTCAKARLAA